MQKKSLSDDEIDRYWNLYDRNFSIVVVNGIQGRCIENKRMSVRQGNTFAMDCPSVSLKGIKSQIAQGPKSQFHKFPPLRPAPTPQLWLTAVRWHELERDRGGVAHPALVRGALGNVPHGLRLEVDLQGEEGGWS